MPEQPPLLLPTGGSGRSSLSSASARWVLPARIPRYRAQVIEPQDSLTWDFLIPPASRSRSPMH
jgi:hypothetical protein